MIVYERFPYSNPSICLILPADSAVRWTPSPSAIIFPNSGELDGLHPLEYVSVRRTKNRPLTKLGTAANINPVDRPLSHRLFQIESIIALTLRNTFPAST